MRAIITAGTFRCDTPPAGDTHMSTPSASHKNDVFGCPTVVATSEHSLSAL